MPGLAPEHAFSTLRYGSLQCLCGEASHYPRFVAVTGGPGAGKTAVLELAVRSFCRHVAVLPEAASIVFGGGFRALESMATDPVCGMSVDRLDTPHFQVDGQTYYFLLHQLSGGVCSGGQQQSP